MYILKSTQRGTFKPDNAYLQKCEFTLGAVRPITTKDKDKAMAFDSKAAAIQFRDDNLTGSWTAIEQ